MSDVSVEVLLGQLLQGAISAQLVEGLVHRVEQFWLAFAQGDTGFLAGEGSTGGGSVRGFLGVFQGGQAVDQDGVGTADAQVLELGWSSL